MSELTWIDLIMALERANTFACELDVAEELDSEYTDRIYKLLQDIKKEKKKIYRG